MMREELQPYRMDYAVSQIEKHGYTIHERTESTIKFMFNGNEITMFPYTGWHTGKGIIDGRGISKLINQIKK